MRHLLSFAILLGGARLLTASAITTGNVVLTAFVRDSILTQSAGVDSSATFSGPDIAINLLHRLPAPICSALPGATCNMPFSQTFNLVVDNAFQPGGTVTFGGTTYQLGANPNTPPNTSFVLNLSFSGPTVPIPVAGCLANGCGIVGDTSGVPFTMTGTTSSLTTETLSFRTSNSRDSDMRLI